MQKKGKCCRYTSRGGVTTEGGPQGACVGHQPWRGEGRAGHHPMDGGLTMLQTLCRELRTGCVLSHLRQALSCLHFPNEKSEDQGD